MAAQTLGDLRQDRGSYGTMYQERFACVADTHSLALGVFDDADRHLQIRMLIEIDVTVAIVVFDDRHLGFTGYPSDQSFATAGDGDIDQVSHRQEVTDRRSIGCRYKLDGSLRDPDLRCSVGQDIDDRLAAVDRFFPASQDHRIATFDTDRCRISGNIRPAFINEKDDPQWNPSLFDAKAARPSEAIDDFADGIGEPGDFPKSGRDSSD